MLVDLVRREREESAVIDEVTVCEPKLPQTISSRQQGCDGSVANLVALVEIDFQDIGTMLGESKNSVIAQLSTFVKFQLQR